VNSAKAETEFLETTGQLMGTGFIEAPSTPSLPSTPSTPSLPGSVPHRANGGTKR
jgi:hypothetical protein